MPGKCASTTLLLVMLLALARLHKARARAGRRFELTKYTPVRVAVPVGNDGESGRLDVYVPNQRASGAVADPQTLLQSVQGVWNTVVEPNQAGLVDAKQQGVASLPLSANEAWHHYTAGQQGVIDSARFLIAFSVVPSVQSGGSELHTAAAHNDVQSIGRLLSLENTEANNLFANVDEEKMTDGTTPLFTAVALGHVEATRSLLEHGANVNHVARTGATPLMVAASLGNMAIVKLLVEEKRDSLDLDYQHTFAKTSAMHFAAEMGRAEIVTYLCENGADPHSRKKTGGTPLHTASDTNQSAVVEVLLSETCGSRHTDLMNRDTSPLYLAAQRGFTSVLRVLIAHGADVNFVMPSGKYSGVMVATDGRDGGLGSGEFYPPRNTEIGNGATALHAAVENGHLEAARLLLDEGAEQLSSMQGASPILIALQYQHPDIALLLLRDGNGDAARINVQTPHDGSFPLLAAAMYGYKAVVTRLLKVGAVHDMTDMHGESALSIAIHNKHIDIAKELLRQKSSGHVIQTAILAAARSGEITLLELLLHGYDGELDTIRDKDGRNPLFSAVQHGHSTLAKMLLETNRANASLAQPKTGLTPLMLAAQKGHHKLVKILIEAGSPVNSKANSKTLYGATALYLACQNGNRAVAKTLLKSHADVNAKLDRIGITPLFISVERGNIKLVKLLLKYNAKVHFRNWNGITAFAMAMLSTTKSDDKTRIELYDILLGAGADVNTQDNIGMTPLQSAVANFEKRRQKVSYLLRHNANINHKNHEGQSILQTAILEVQDQREKLWCVNRLLKWGATVNTDTLLSALRFVNDASIISKLVPRYKQTTDNDMLQVLTTAVNDASVSVVRSLFDLSAIKTLFIQNIDHFLAFARRRREFEIIKFLDGIRETTGS